MSQFTTPLRIEYEDEKNWKLLEPFEYHVDTYPSEKIIQVPTDFITDFASIPRIFWVILSPFGEYGKAAVIHDWLYRTPDCGYTKVEADLIFLSSLGFLSTPSTLIPFSLSSATAISPAGPQPTTITS